MNILAKGFYHILSVIYFLEKRTAMHPKLKVKHLGPTLFSFTPFFSMATNSLTVLIDTDHDYLCGTGGGLDSWFQGTGLDGAP